MNTGTARAIGSAWANGVGLTMGHAYTDGTILTYRNHKIVWFGERPKTVRFSLCGWNTPTTRRYINWAFEAHKIPFRLYQEDFEPYIGRIDQAPAVRDQDILLDSYADYEINLDTWEVS